MKQTIITTLFTAISITAFSQDVSSDRILKFDALLLNKIRATYEKPYSEKISYGGSAAIYYGTVPGFKIDPFVRYYISGECPKGLYGQLRLLAGVFSKKFYYYSDFLSLSVEEKNTRTSFGAGFDLGYQWISGKNKNIPIDVSLGIQLMSDINHTIKKDGVEYSSANIAWATTGPGAIFNPHIMIGFTF